MRIFKVLIVLVFTGYICQNLKELYTQDGKGYFYLNYTSKLT